MAVTTSLWQRAKAVVPGGVNSPVRAWGPVGGEPFFVRRGEGAYVEDTEGRRYVDWVQSWGPLVFGHSDPEIVEAVQEAASEGTTFGAPTEREVELAEEIADAVPSVEKVRLVSSGTEAAMSAVRLARGYLGRELVIHFEGCYHGHSDVLSGESALACRFNDVEGITATARAAGEGLAAIIVEPVGGNMGVVPPEPGFLEALRSLCDDTGALLVFDEVITGFRVARGGAQELYGVTPDLTVLGKIVGGGLPLAAFGGRAEVMDAVAPEGPVFQAGTLSGNPLATAAALVVLRRLRDPGIYEQLEETGTVLQRGLSQEGITVQRVGSMLTPFFGAGPVRDRDDAAACDQDRYSAFFHHLLDRGVYIAPSPFEAMFVSTAHGPAEVERTVEAAKEFVG
ncbi:MAG TPA: glutamate-1-semialdehyde 2,1-aminomutase [Gaiellaceae bacterium]|nr:glutamate-1-semialdehyde 2,1-aminomutase [Gaiellaceae bacterium]